MEAERNRSQSELPHETHYPSSRWLLSPAQILTILDFGRRPLKKAKASP